MSTSSIREFFNHLYQDDELQEAYWQEIGSAMRAAAARFAAARGFEFTADELRDEWAARSAELSEAELDGVSGGLGIHSLSRMEMGDRLQQMAGETGMLGMGGHMLRP